MNTKLCQCGSHVGEKIIPIINFGKNKNFPDGLQPVCRSCRSEAGRKSHERHPETKMVYYTKNKTAINEYNRLKHIMESEFKKERYHANKDKYHAAQARSRKKRKENGKAAEAEKRRKQTCINYRLSQLARDRRKHAIKAQGAKKLMKHIDTLGCTIGFFKEYIESKFLPGMTWENRGQGAGKWHLDEIRPCASFDLTDPEQYKACFHYTNTQPLWAIDNMIKGPIYNGVRYVKRKAA